MNRALYFMALLAFMSTFMGQMAADKPIDRIERWCGTTRTVDGLMLVYGYGYREQSGYDARLDW